VRAHASAGQVALCVLPGVELANFDAVRTLAHRFGDAYALGIHPLYVEHARDEDLGLLDAALTRLAGDPRLVAVGEIGLDYFMPELTRRRCRPGRTPFIASNWCWRASTGCR